MSFDKALKDWLDEQIRDETNPRRKERLQRGLGYGETEFLRRAWFPAVGNFQHLHAEWEIRDYRSRFRYLDFAYMPGNAKGAIELQGFGSHARDIDIDRFKDLCIRHSLLALEDWTLLPIAHAAVMDDPKFCQQLILAFIGKFLATPAESRLSWLEVESLRFARRLLRPFAPSELAAHLRISTRYTRTILHKLVGCNLICVADGSQRIRTYMPVSAQQPK